MGQAPCGNLPVTTIDGPRRVPERARDLDRGARDVARESILVEENSAMVQGDHVEVLRQGTVGVGDKACTFLYADHMPWTTEVRGQQARIRTSCRSSVPR